MFKKLLFFGVLLTVGLLFLAYFYWQWALKPVNSRQPQAKIFVVPKGQSAQVIAKRLKNENLIKSSLVFELLVDRKDLEAKLQAGDFRLSSAMDLPTIIESLTHGSLDYWITFPEGLRAEEYAAKLASQVAVDPQAFILVAKPNEGRLFPDTYLIPRSASAEDIVDLLVKTFDQKSPTQDFKTIIIASLIEREARHAQDRSLVSSVIHNRLQIGMALQIDATVQYLVGQEDSWWPKELTKNDLKLNSPYNTYLYPGLPPQPIANPGLAALEAALHPAETDYLYYVSDTSGYNHYAVTLEEHQQNINQYLNR